LLILTEIELGRCLKVEGSNHDVQRDGRLILDEPTCPLDCQSDELWELPQPCRPRSSSRRTITDGRLRQASLGENLAGHFYGNPLIIRKIKAVVHRGIWTCRPGGISWWRGWCNTYRCGSSCFTPNGTGFVIRLPQTRDEAVKKLLDSQHPMAI